MCFFSLKQKQKKNKNLPILQLNCNVSFSFSITLSFLCVAVIIIFVYILSRSKNKSLMKQLFKFLSLNPFVIADDISSWILYAKDPSSQFRYLIHPLKREQPVYFVSRNLSHTLITFEQDVIRCRPSCDIEL